MAQKYGERWETVGQLGQGGQSEVFKVRDLYNLDAPFAALKRVKNPKRHARFATEVEAIKRLDHPHIIKLLDHSALDHDASGPSKQYLVMPIADGGDLEACVSRYKDNLDGTLIVARQLTAALRSAHDAGVIHRDVKPKNILFAGMGNDVWLADFGIALLGEQERLTEHGEVAGPWAFMAPELEDGGPLEVTPSVDVYSLGKVIYYMLTGGAKLPRERLADPSFARQLKSGGRFDLVRSLLGRMICTLPNRIRDMRTLDLELARIQDWDQVVAAAPILPSATEKLARLRSAVEEDTRRLADNRDKRAHEQALHLEVRAQVGDWFRRELVKIGAAFPVEGALTAAVQDAEEPRRGVYGYYLASNGVELAVGHLDSQRNRTFALQFLICQNIQDVVVDDDRRPYIPNDRYIGVLACLSLRFDRHPMSGSPTSSTCFLGPSGTLKVIATSDKDEPFRVDQAIRANQNPLDVMFMRFRTSEWPSVESQLRPFVERAFDTFLDAMERNRNSTALR
ncbi:serine/threonine-protein kinase [Burkholderia sp. SRS-25]|uniref:serine/threonine-protein kinase n=1 Tax=Burkholderia sp. SRS-25 TaxID=2094190 RepID=UPI00104317B0|nr:serine/threonine-protein kinase [Burkholderia sp. SRS-25]TCW64260.1 hypothetical protein C5O79_32390 [Burkholderia sp. SRS-25]